MRHALLSLAKWAAALAILLVVTAAIATWVKRRNEIDAVPDEQKIARSLEIIRTSTPTDHKVLKVLFYGQSITRSGWHTAVVDHWHKMYPNTVFVVQNRAIGGFPDQSLVRTTEQDIAAFYPDLIIFHVYGDERSYERILRLFRSRTAADVIVQTDHGDVMPDPPCREGLQQTLHRQPGCVGVGWLHQRLWVDEMSYHKVPALAKKYGLALEPQRGWWRDYLLRMHLEPKALLADNVHPNAKGKELLALFFNKYFDDLVQRWDGQHEDNVASIALQPSNDAGGHRTVQFDGDRLELISSQPLAAWPAVTVDGAAPKDIDGCYQVTRASSIGTVPDWPAVRKITLRHDHLPEDWVLTLTKISPDQQDFDFKVGASVGGDEGSGSSAGDFVSRSGRVGIEAQDWMLKRAFDGTHVPLQAPFQVRWSVNYVCGGGAEVIDRGNGATEYRYILATGLANGHHSILLTCPANDLANVVEFRAYRPPLGKD